MAYLYVTEQGARLHKTGDRLVVTKSDERLLEVRCRDVEGVMLFGNVHFTTPAVRELMEHGIEMALLTLHGELVCQLTPPTARNVSVRLAQYRCAQDAELSLKLARTLVEAKVANSLALVRAHAKNYPEPALTSAIADLESTLGRIPAIVDVDVLLGLEGQAAKAYFRGFAKMIRGNWTFDGRHKRPPRDPVNSLLSFGYTLLFNEMASLLDGIGFDPYIGFFHQPSYGRPSLAADLIEEFRAPIVDRLTLRLLNNRMLAPDDFTVEAGIQGVRLTRDALKRYLAEYDRLLGRIASDLVGDTDDVNGQATDGSLVGDGTRTDAPRNTRSAPDTSVRTFRRRFREQAYALERALLHDEPYSPYRS